MTHSPTPWKVVSKPHFDNGYVYTSVQPINIDEDAMKPLLMANGEYHICRMSHTAAEWRFNYHRANAEFIVTAVNAYEANQALIRQLVEALSSLRGQALQSDINVPSNECGMEALNKSSAALSAAKEAGF